MYRMLIGGYVCFFYSPTVDPNAGSILQKTHSTAAMTRSVNLKEDVSPNHF
jgi:hypothetical protein